MLLDDTTIFGLEAADIKYIKISFDPISWATCGRCFTLYLTSRGKVIICHDRVQGERILVKIEKKAVSVFAGCDYGGIIDEDGTIHILDAIDPRKLLKSFSLESPATDLECCSGFICALTSDSCVFADGELSGYSEDLGEVSSLKGVKVEKLSGYYDACAALTSDGRVFMYRSNECGQFGDGTTLETHDSFTEVELNEEIKDVSCSFHTLFLTKSNKILGCGLNDKCQLFMKTNETNVFSSILITTMEADHVITGNSHSFISAKKFFAGKKTNMETSQPKEESFMSIKKPDIRKENPTSQPLNQSEKIDSILQICRDQSQSISQLTDLCRSLQQQNESSKKEIKEIRETHEKEINKIRNELRMQTSKNDELKAQIEEISSKIDNVIKYIIE